MSLLFNYLFEFSLCLAISWGFYKLLLERLTFFELNRSYLLGTLLLSLLIPFMSFEYQGATPLMAEITLPEVGVGGLQNQPESQTWFSALSWPEYLIIAYALGAVIMLIQFVLGLAKSFLILHKSNLIKSDQVIYAVHPEFQPASFFNYILLPEFRPEDPDQQQIIIHESIHVAKKHTWDLLLIQGAKVILWFNPVIYLFEKSLREIHEFQADQGVTRTHSPFDYSRLLVRLISGQKSFECIHYFSQFQTKKRIIMMNKMKSTSSQKFRVLFFTPILALLIVAFACENQQAKDEHAVIMQNPDNETMPEKDELYKNMPITKVPADEVFDVVEEAPVPNGGMDGWIEYLIDNLEYPKEARQAGVGGVVIVGFVVNEDGSISDSYIEKGIGSGCDEEALRVVSQAPKWTAGKQKGKAVKVRMRLPINFKLGPDEETLASNKLFQHRFAGFDLTPQGLRATNTKIVPMASNEGC